MQLFRQKFLLEQTPISTVGRIISIISHHKIEPRRNSGNCSIFIILSLLLSIFCKINVLDPNLHTKCIVFSLCKQYQSILLLVFFQTDLFIIKNISIVNYGNFISRFTNKSLYKRSRIMRRNKYHNITYSGVSARANGDEVLSILSP